MLSQGTWAKEGPTLPLFWMCLLTQASVISWEALAESLPAEAMMLLLPGHVVLGGLGTSERKSWCLATAGRTASRTETWPLGSSFSHGETLGIMHPYT